VGELVQTFNWMATRLADLDRMKADFIAHVSHELRTPLTGIQEGTALLLEQIPGPLTATQQQILGVVRNHSMRLARHITSILDLSKMEADMLEYVRVPSNPAVLLERGVEAVQLMAQKKRLRIEVLSTSTLPDLCLDEGRMQQVLDNLLSNAVKFTPEGGTIRMVAGLQGEDQRWVEIRVCDTGQGIPAEDVARIFDKFYQSSYHRQERQQGTGLGLTIARHIVEAHGGQIWAESQVGEGTTFVVRLPVRHSETNLMLASPAIGHDGVGHVA
jgi:two-component system sensor histidine kinase GlrK